VAEAAAETTEAVASATEAVAEAAEEVAGATTPEAVSEAMVDMGRLDEVEIRVELRVELEAPAKMLSGS